MKAFLHRLVNIIHYGRNTDHWPHDWWPVGFADWKCKNCGAWR